MRTPYKCVRCGLVNPMGSLTCQACGANLTGSTPPTPKGGALNSFPTVASSLPSPSTARSPGGSSTSIASPVAVTPASRAGFALSALAPFGWTSLDGRIIHVEPLYMGPPDFRWGLLLLKLAVFGGVVYYGGALLLVMAAVLIVVAVIVGRMFRGRFMSALALQVTSFILTRRLLGGAASVPIRDCRVRDSNGEETLVRMKGQLASGSVTVGDDVHVEGLRRAGMLLFRRGYNHRIRAAIRVTRA